MDFLNIDPNLIKYLIISVAGLVVTFTVVFFVLKKIGRNPRNILPVNFAHRIRIPLIIFIIALALRIGIVSKVFDDIYVKTIAQTGTLLFILSITWFLIIFVKVFKNWLVSKYDISVSDK